MFRDGVFQERVMYLVGAAVLRHFQSVEMIEVLAFFRRVAPRSSRAGDGAMTSGSVAEQRRRIAWWYREASQSRLKPMTEKAKLLKDQLPNVIT